MARVICNLPATQLSKFALGVLTRSAEVFSYVEFEEHTLKTLQNLRLLLSMDILKFVRLVNYATEFSFLSK